MVAEREDGVHTKGTVQVEKLRWGRGRGSKNRKKVSESGPS